MTLREAVYEVMSQATRPMHYKNDVWRLIESRRLWQPQRGGDTPWHTARVAMRGDPRYKRVGRGLFVLVGRPVAGRTSRDVTQPVGRMTLGDAVHVVMSEASGEMHYKDVLREIRARRLHAVSGGTPANSVSKCLTTDSRYTRTRRGYYVCADRAATRGDRHFKREIVEEGSNAELSSEHQALDSRLTRVEVALRDSIARTLDGNHSLLPQHIAVKVNERLRTSGRRSARMDIEHSADLTMRLEFCDLRELQGIIASDSLWQQFSRRFGSKETLIMRFDQLAELRNALRHTRTVDEIALKEGEVAIMWFERILKQ